MAAASPTPTPMPTAAPVDRAGDDDPPIDAEEVMVGFGEVGVGKLVAGEVGDETVVVVSSAMFHPITPMAWTADVEFSVFVVVSKSTGFTQVTTSPG